MTSCDICGVLRFPPSNSGSGADKKSGNATLVQIAHLLLMHRLFSSIYLYSKGYLSILYPLIENFSTFILIFIFSFCKHGIWR